MLRLIPGWPRLQLLLAPPLAGVGILAAAFALAPPAVPASPAPLAAAAPVVPPPAGLLVHVAGAVAHPGLYRLQRGDRVSAAIAAAGGFAPGADSSRMPNLAGRLRDGEQVKVPFSKGAAGGATAARVAINSATVEELAAVPGFSPELAQAVVDYRDRYGPLTSLSELTSVLGMSKSDYALAKKSLTLA
ncbi:MAG: ComEA family DNA-binding protein [Chloroflexi bacterium]|nr:MAG: ComEA family DNA-binding protein [Chloroflexota bacterium]